MGRGEAKNRSRSIIDRVEIWKQAARVDIRAGVGVDARQEK